MALRFQLFRFPVTLHLSFLLMAVVLGAGRWRQPDLLLIWVGIVFVSVLWHELGHAVAFRAFGRESAISLVAMGGETRDVSEKPLPPWQDIVVSAAGPAFGLAAAAVVLGVIRYAAPAENAVVTRLILADLLWVNGLWSVLNLLPMLPLDGGRVVYSALRTRWKDGAIVPASLLSLAVAILATGFAVRFGWYFSAMIAVSFAFLNGQAIVAVLNGKEETAVAEAVEAAERALEEKDLAGARRAAELSVRVARRRALKDVGYALVAIVEMREGRQAEARAAIATLRAYEVSDEILARLEKELGDAGMTREAEETARLRAERGKTMSAKT